MPSDPAISTGTIVLVTGFTGYVGSAIAKALLDAGYKVRGATRSESKAQSLVESFNAQYGEGSVEVVSVKAMKAPGAFDEAVKGVAGVIHVASFMGASKDPKEVVTPAIECNLSILRSASQSPTVKRFVLTSSVVAAGLAPEATSLDENSWNDASVKVAWSSSADKPGLAWHIYAASKAEGEKAAHNFMKEEKPGFVFNSVLPGVCLGPAADPSVVLSTGGWVNALMTGDDRAWHIPPWFVDVRDVALLHLAALTTAEPYDRIYAVEGLYSYNDAVAVLRKLHPEKDIPDRSTKVGLVKIDNSKSLKLLKELGRPGYRTLETTLKDQTSVVV